MRWLYLLFFLTTTHSLANVIYSYQGNPFTDVSGAGGPTTSNSITLSFEVLNPLAANLVGWNANNVYAFGLVNWTISDGVSTLSSHNVNVALLAGVATDATGNITDWDFVGQTSDATIWLSTVNPTYTCCPGPIDASARWANGTLFAPTASASNAETPGQWTSTVAEVPEPSALAPLSLFLFLLGVANDKRQHNPPRAKRVDRRPETETV